MLDEIAGVLRADDRVLYGLVFGSSARGTTNATSDLDVAIELAPAATVTPLEIGALVSALESVTSRVVDLVLLDEAPPVLGYRIFRDGEVVFVRDRKALVDRRARVILEYFDFEPIERLCTDGVLRAAAHGR